MNVDIEAAGAAATAALAASELESGTHKQSNSEHPVACANCGAPLQGAYCHGCGQSAHVHRSLWHMLEEGMHGIFHFDTKSWRTLPLLLGRPGLLTKRYIHGQRVRYVSPLALFLFTVFVMFFVVSQLPDPLANITLSSAPGKQSFQAGLVVSPDPAAPEVAQEMAQEMKKSAAANPAGASATELAAAAARARQAASKAPGSDGLNVNLVLPRLPEGVGTGNQKVDEALRNPQLTLYKIKNTAYKLSFMLIPISLPFLWLMFCRRPGVFMYDHMVFSMYSLSFMSLWFMLIALMSAHPTSARWVAAACVLPPLHMFLHLREAYALGKWATLWRTAVLLTVAGTVFVAFLLAVVAISVR